MIMPDLLSTPRILLVDDEAEPLQLCAQVIKMCGFPVLTASSPMEAICIMTEKLVGRIDLVILDYNMPIMSGCALSDRLKPMWPEMKIILRSGAIYIPQCEMTSVDTFIPKGEGIGQLLAQIIRLAQIRMLPPATVATVDQNRPCERMTGRS
ncbi:MAG: response regulator [Candidatus Korobacteraceae bacterium]|jgi:CheY-like chemotaxis protein